MVLHFGTDYQLAKPCTADSTTVLYKLVGIVKVLISSSDYIKTLNATVVHGCGVQIEGLSTITGLDYWTGLLD